MSKCDACSNEYENTFSITSQGKTFTFDSFECAIHALAPTCAHCGCKVVGHGVEHDNAIFCCESCVRHACMATH